MPILDSWSHRPMCVTSRTNRFNLLMISSSTDPSNLPLSGIGRQLLYYYHYRVPSWQPCSLFSLHLCKPLRVKRSNWSHPVCDPRSPTPDILAQNNAECMRHTFRPQLFSPGVRTTPQTTVAFLRRDWFPVTKKRGSPPTELPNADQESLHQKRLRIHTKEYQHWTGKRQKTITLSRKRVFQFPS